MLENFQHPGERDAYTDMRIATLDAFGSTDGSDYFTREGGRDRLDEAYERAVTEHGVDRVIAIGLLLAAQLECEFTIRELAALKPEDFNEQVET